MAVIFLYCFLYFVLLYVVFHVCYMRHIANNILCSVLEIIQIETSSGF